MVLLSSLVYSKTGIVKMFCLISRFRWVLTVLVVRWLWWLGLGVWSWLGCGLVAGCWRLA